MTYRRLAPSDARRRYALKRETVIVLPDNGHLDSDVELLGVALKPHTGAGRPSLDAVARLITDGRAPVFYQEVK